MNFESVFEYVSGFLKIGFNEKKISVDLLKHSSQCHDYVLNKLSESFRVKNCFSYEENRIHLYFINLLPETLLLTGTRSKKASGLKHFLRSTRLEKRVSLSFSRTG